MNEEEIIRSILRGGKDEDAGVRALYDQFARPMLHFFVYRGVSGGTAHDVLQETIIKIVKGASSYTGQGKAKAWIWQIARNCLLDHLKKTGALGKHELLFDNEQWQRLEETVAGIEHSGAETSVEDCVSVVVSEFAKEMPDRAYVLTLQMEGKSIQEIGLRIDRTVAATKEYLRQCRLKIEPYLIHCMELLSA